jgi:3-deoxy-manno-octulosonate cytidylyltransferase (CMP-KDO synthetase)
MSFKVYIPARYASSRLPGKPLLSIGGKPVVQHVYENALSSGADEVVIATDDERIVEAARGFGATVVRTRDTHPSGTDRIAEAVAARGEGDDTIIVNVQGDEPQLPAAVIHQVAALIESNAAADIASVCEPIEERAAIDDPNIVKVVRAADDRALYFSRAPIPHAREGRGSVLAQYRRHVGIYAYRVAYLRRFVATEPAELEQLECLEQLRALTHNAVIVVADAVAQCGVGVDTQADFERLVGQWGATA